MTTLVVTGTSTDVGKTVVTAVLAAAVTAEGRSVAVCKPVQTGVTADEPGDLAETIRLAGDITVAECARYPEPLAPDTAARRARLPQVRLSDVVSTIRTLGDAHDLVLVEGAGGVMVRLADDLTVLDVAEATDAAVIVVVPAGLGALNHAELTVAAITGRGLRVAGLIIGSWPHVPDLAAACNRTDLPRVTGVPIVGSVPQGAGALDVDEFRLRAGEWIAPDWVAGELARDNADR